MIINEKYIKDIDDEDDGMDDVKDSFKVKNTNKKSDFNQRLIFTFERKRESLSLGLDDVIADAIVEMKDIVIDVLDDFDFEYSEDFEYYASSANFEWCTETIEYENGVVLHLQKSRFYPSTNYSILVHLDWGKLKPFEVLRFANTTFKRMTSLTNNIFIFRSFYPQSKMNSRNCVPFDLERLECINTYKNSRSPIKKASLSFIKDFFNLCSIFANTEKIIPLCRKMIKFNGMEFIKAQVLEAKGHIKKVFEKHSILNNIKIVLDYIFFDIDNARPRLFRSIDGFDMNMVCYFSKEYIQEWAEKNEVGMNIAVYRQNGTYYGIFMFDKPFESAELVDIVFVLELNDNMLQSNAYDINISDFCVPIVAACGTYGNILKAISSDGRELSQYVIEDIDERINEIIENYDNK